MTNHKCYIAVRLTLPAFVFGADHSSSLEEAQEGLRKDMDGWVKQKNSGQAIGSSNHQFSVSTQNDATPHDNFA